MKISKKSWLIVAIGIFAIAFAGLWMVYSEHLGRKYQVMDELNSTRLRLQTINLDRMQQQQTDLEQQLEQTLASSRNAREVLSWPMESLAVNEVLFVIAEANNITITQINSAGINQEELYGVNCNSLPVTARIEGELTDLVAFVTQLNNDMATGVVKSVDITIPSGTDPSTATVQMTVYSYEQS
jgi:hypothetical protein